MSTTPTGPANQPGSERTSSKGPFGGGNKYTQMPPINNNLTTIKPITGHTQQGNIKPVIHNGTLYNK